MPISSSSSNSSSCSLETELRLGLPGSRSSGKHKDCDPDGSSLTPLSRDVVTGSKRCFSVALFPPGCKTEISKGVKVVPQPPNPLANEMEASDAAPPKTQVIGWPPIRSFRRNAMASDLTKRTDDVNGKAVQDCLYVKVSMDGAPYLRRVDLKAYNNYAQLSSALRKMFICFTIGQSKSDASRDHRFVGHAHGDDYVLIYEDKDGDWMLVGDVPWKMFIISCRMLRITKGTEAIGLGDI